MDQAARETVTVVGPTQRGDNEAPVNIAALATAIDTALARQGEEHTRRLATLQGEVVQLRAQIAELSDTLLTVQQQLRVLDRDTLRSEQRDRELLEAVQQLHARDAGLLSVARRPSQRRWPWQRLMLTRRAGRC